MRKKDRATRRTDDLCVDKERAEYERVGLQVKLLRVLPEQDEYAESVNRVRKGVGDLTRACSESLVCIAEAFARLLGPS